MSSHATALEQETPDPFLSLLKISFTYPRTSHFTLHCKNSRLMKPKKEAEEMSGVTVNRFAEGKSPIMILPPENEGIFAVWSLLCWFAVTNNYLQKK